MKRHRRIYALIIVFTVFVLCVILTRTTSRTQKKSFAVVDPSTKKHWFRIKIIDHPRSDRRPKVILLWTGFFGVKDYIRPLSELKCPVSDCLVTSNRSYLSVSDAVMFHLRDTSLSDMPVSKPSWQVWILLHHEAPPHTPKIIHYFNGYINWTATHRFDSEIVLTPTAKKKKVPEADVPHGVAKNKTKLVAWFVSNCLTPSNRENYVKELQKHIPVDIYGYCGEKECMPKASKECYQKIANEYRYYLSFENSICKDYVTEKFFNILDYDIIPVVMGGANYTQVAPPGSFIDAFSFPSPKALADFLIDLAKDDNRYDSYFRWRQKYTWSVEPYACQICKKLHEHHTPLWYDDLHRWWFRDAHCRKWELK